MEANDCRVFWLGLSGPAPEYLNESEHLKSMLMNTVGQGCQISYVEQRLLLSKGCSPQIALLPTAIIFSVLRHCKSCLSIYSVIVLPAKWPGQGGNKRLSTHSFCPGKGSEGFSVSHCPFVLAQS